uniref:Uncharacterized protein n=1 Tax=Acrobeloides nanus TaxID=290746 RepID=A0A914EEZ5_9BILA
MDAESCPSYESVIKSNTISSPGYAYNQTLREQAQQPVYSINYGMMPPPRMVAITNGRTGDTHYMPTEEHKKEQWRAFGFFIAVMLISFVMFFLLVTTC